MQLCQFVLTNFVSPFNNKTSVVAGRLTHRNADHELTSCDEERCNNLSCKTHTSKIGKSLIKNYTQNVWDTEDNVMIDVIMKFLSN